MKRRDLQSKKKKQRQKQNEKQTNKQSVKSVSFPTLQTQTWQHLLQVDLAVVEDAHQPLFVLDAMRRLQTQQEQGVVYSILEWFGQLRQAGHLASHCLCTKPSHVGLDKRRLLLQSWHLVCHHFEALHTENILETGLNKQMHLSYEWKLFKQAAANFSAKKNPQKTKTTKKTQQQQQTKLCRDMSIKCNTLISKHMF